MESAEIDSRSPSMKMTVHIKRYREWSIRLWIASRLMKLGAWIAWLGFEEDDDDYVYRCPKCKSGVRDELPEVGKDSVIICPECNYQFLFILDRPRLVGLWYECEHGCHWQEPYGFVSMDDCPIHD